MTVPSTQQRAGPYLGNGSASVWPFEFQTLSASDLQVVLRVGTAETLLVLDSDYTVTLNADQITSPGGSILCPIVGDPIPQGQTLVIRGQIPLGQSTDLPDGGAFRARTVEEMADKLALQILQLSDDIGRTVRLPVSAPADVSTALPLPEANKYLGWNSSANALINRSVTEIAYGNFVTEVFSGDGITSSFTLTGAPGTADNCDVAIGGVVQNSVSDFTLAGNVVTFTDAPPSGVDIISIRYGQAMQVAFGPTGPRGPVGPTGVRGPRGLQGVKGDPGNYVGLDLIGTGTTLASRPASATEGQGWGLLGTGTIRIYVWASGAWYDAGTITSAAAYSVANTIFVQEFGDDLNSGTSWTTAVRTIEKALELATARGEPTLIEWAPESTVLTQGHLDMPDNCAIVAKHRTVHIQPEAGYEQRNVFRMGSGCYVEGLMIEGFQVNSLTNPTEGFAFSFRPGAVIQRVPYVHKCAVRSLRTWGLVAPPLDRDGGNPEVGYGPGVVLADGAVCSQYSVFPNIMTWGATPVSHNGIGYCAKNGGLINAVNAVSMWCHKHFLALSGGQIILSACSTQFGDYTMWAEGSRNVVVPTEISSALTVQAAAAAAITAASTTLVNDMWTALVANGYTTGWTAADEAYTRSDGALLLQCLAWVLNSANEQPMIDFAKGLFDVVGAPVYAAGKEAAFIFAFEFLRDGVNALAGVNAASDAIVTALIAALLNTIDTPTTRIEPSKITAISHTWTAVLAGVALTKIPPARNSGSITDSIREITDGVVVASGQDDFGNALFVGGLEINAETGELGGPPFDQAVRRIATRAAISRSF